jgi:hypothetical protein
MILFEDLTVDKINNIREKYFNVHGKNKEAEEIFKKTEKILKQAKTKSDFKKAMKELHAAIKNAKEPTIKKFGGNILKKSNTVYKNLNKDINKVGSKKLMNSLNIDQFREVGRKFGVKGILNKLNNHSGTIGAVVLAALLAYGSYKLYQKYKKNGLNHCAKMSGGAKKKCFEDIVKKAELIQQNGLRSSIIGCKKSSDPNKCRKLIMDKIDKLRNNKEK